MIELDDLANYLDLTFIIDGNNGLSPNLYRKHDNFSFYIVNFPFPSSNIPSAFHMFSQLIKYARCDSHDNDLGYLPQTCEIKRLKNSFKTFYGRRPDLIRKYQKLAKDKLESSQVSFHAVTPMTLSFPFFPTQILLLRMSFCNICC